MTMLTDDIVHLFIPQQGLWQVPIDPLTNKIPFAPDVDLRPPGGGLVANSDVGARIEKWQPGICWKDCTLLVAACPCCRTTPWTHEEALSVEAELFDWLIEHGMHVPEVFHDQDDGGEYYVGIEFPCGPSHVAEEVV